MSVGDSASDEDPPAPDPGGRGGVTGTGDSVSGRTRPGRNLAPEVTR